MRILHPKLNMTPIFRFYCKNLEIFSLALYYYLILVLLYLYAEHYKDHF